MSAHVWNAVAIEILKNNWQEKSPPEIRDLVDEYNKAHPFKSGNWFMCSTGGVIWKATELGFISDEEGEELRKKYKRKGVQKKDRGLIIKRDGGCVICRRADDLQVDHIKPVRFGGADTPDNLQTLCKTCHDIKDLETIDCRKLVGSTKISIKKGRHPDEIIVSYEIRGEYGRNKTAHKLISDGLMGRYIIPGLNAAIVK